VDQHVFDAFRAFIHAQTGVNMHKGKEALLRARIAERMRALGIEDETVYLQRVRSDHSGGELRLFINAITTNTTSFFRTPEHFQILNQHIARWAASGGARFRAWSAASSTGEEPWSMVMVMARAVPDWASRDVRLLATDIDTDVLAEARLGRYREHAAASAPPEFRQRCFVPGGQDEGGPWVAVRPDLRAMASFAQLNLVRPPYPMRGPFDIIFCRNVLIYFDHETRVRTLSAMVELLSPDGLLVLGPSESAMGLEHLVRRATDSVYVPRRGP
jgi:chemotaxis protein methyltransferase CheR